jgi:hypothetical protein
MFDCPKRQNKTVVSEVANCTTLGACVALVKTAEETCGKWKTKFTFDLRPHILMIEYRKAVELTLY